MDKDIPLIPLESLKFIFRHPWYFIYPFVVVLSVIFSYATNIPSMYEANAILSFGAMGSESTSQRFAQRKQKLVARALFGDSVRRIVKDVWPNIAKATDDKRYSIITSKLRDPRNGIKIRFDGLDPSMVRISYAGYKPETCSRVVQATIDALKLENDRIVEESVDSSISFLKRQLNSYKDKVTAIDTEILRTSTKVKDMMAGLDLEDKAMIYKILNESIMEQQYGSLFATEEKESMDELAKLVMKVAETKKLKQVLEARLANKEFDQVDTEYQMIQQQVIMKSIEEKKLAMFGLVSRGYLPEHPDVKRLSSEIEELESFKEKQLQEKYQASSRMLSPTELKLAELSLKNKIKDLNIIIDAMEKKRVSLEESYREIAKTSAVAPDSLMGLTTAEATKLNELKVEKSINERYYNDFRKQLEETSLRGTEEKESAGFIISVVEPPKVPSIPVPAQKNNTLFIGVILASCAGLALSYLADILDRSIRSAMELRNKFNIPVIASIDRIYAAGDIKAIYTQRAFIITSMLISGGASIVIVKIVMSLTDKTL